MDDAPKVAKMIGNLCASINGIGKKASHLRNIDEVIISVAQIKHGQQLLQF